MQISLIGPSGVGKSTVSKILASHYKIEHVSLDSLRRQRYGNELDEVGIDRFSEEANIYIVQNVLQEYQERDCILDFGAMNCAYKKEEHFDRFREYVRQLSNVVLLLPSNDFLEGDTILSDRNAITRHLDEKELCRLSNEHRIIFDSNTSVTQSIIYTKNFEPEVIAQRIISIVGV